MVEILEVVIKYAAMFAEAAAVFVITFGAVRGLWIYVTNIRSKDRWKRYTIGRIKLGHSLVLGLEFLIAADILKTAVAPDWDDILQLGAIVGIRTVLNYFLDWELEKVGEAPGTSK